MPSDAELVQIVLNGDRQAYGRLLERHERSVLAVVLAVLGDFHDAQDVCQDAFVKAYENLGRLRKRASFGPWVREIARREAIDIRRRMRQRRKVEFPAEELDDPSSDGEIGEQNRLLLDAVMRLPGHERDVIMLRYFEGHSMKTISEMTGRPVGTVTMQLSRARSHLQKWLKES